MLKPPELFDGPIMDTNSFIRAVDAFSEGSSFFYHGWDLQGVDLYPKLPLCVESDQGGHLVWVLGLVLGNRPGKALLVGVAKVRGFKSNVHSAFEVLPGIPASLSGEAQQNILKAIRKRMRNGVALLARKADLIAYNDSREYENGLLSVLQNSTFDSSKEGRPSEYTAVGWPRPSEGTAPRVSD
jgi:hypothetical protein